jgi:hypothetical protein
VSLKRIWFDKDLSKESPTPDTLSLTISESGQGDRVVNINLVVDSYYVNDRQWKSSIIEEIKTALLPEGRIDVSTGKIQRGINRNIRVAIDFDESLTVVCSGASTIVGLPEEPVTV